MKLKEIPLPKNKIILGRKIKIKEADLLVDNEGRECWGLAHPDDGIVEVSKNSPSKWGVYIHECLHIVDEESSLLEGCTEEEDKLAHKLLEAHSKFFVKELQKFLNLAMKIKEKVDAKTP